MHKIEQGGRKGGSDMLVIEGNSVYEIDEECVRKRKVPKECRVYEKILQKQQEKQKQKGTHHRPRS